MTRLDDSRCHFNVNLADVEERGYQVGRYIIITEGWRRKSQREEESESRRISRFKGRRLVGWIEISR